MADTPSPAPVSEPAAPAAKADPPAAKAERGTVDSDGVLKDHGARLARLEAMSAAKKPADDVAPPPPVTPAPPKRRVRTMLE